MQRDIMTEGPNYYYYYYPTHLPLSIPGVAGSIVRFHSIIRKKRTRKPCRETLWLRVPIIIIIIIPPLFPYPYLVLQDPLSGFIQLSVRKEPGNHTERSRREIIMMEGPNYYYYYPTSLPLSIPGVAGSIVRFHSIISKKRTRKPCRETLWWRVPIIIIIIPPLFPYPYLVLQDPLSGFIQLSVRKEPGSHTERSRREIIMMEGPNYYYYYYPTHLPLSIPGVAGSIVRFHSIISKKRTRKPCREIPERDYYDGGSQLLLLLLSHPSSLIHTWCCRIHCQVSFNYQQEKNQKTM